MTRQTVHRTIQTERVIQVTSYACDACGKVITPDGEDEYASELIISLDRDQCASATFRRDYCTEHLKPVWLALCALIGADPEALGFDRQDEDG